MDLIFGKKKTPAELMKQYKRSIDHTVRDLDRERTKMQMQEKKLVADMKKMAQQNQMEAVKIMAKDLVRTKKYVTKFYRMKAQMQAVSLRLQTLKSTAEMTTAMKGVTRAMMTMNKKMNVPEMQKIMREFAKQSEMMDMKEEMMSDMIDDVMDDAEDEIEEDEAIGQVLDEIGLSLDGKIKVNAGKATAHAEEEETSELEARLENLRK